MALWDLASPIFLGAFLALVSVIMLMGKTHKLLRGPKALLAWINGGRRACGRRRHAKKKHRAPAARKQAMRRQWKMARRWKKPAVGGGITKVFAVPTPAPSSLMGTVGATSAA